MSLVSEIIFEKISCVLPKTKTAISLHEPYIDQDDAACVSSTVLSGWVSYQGEMVNNFEKSLEKYLNVPYVVSMVNGTAALYIALKALGLKPNDEVIIPSLTFAATANAVCHTGAIPHFVDSCGQTLAIDFDKLEIYLDSAAFLDDAGRLINKTTKNEIKAIIPVHVLGASFNIARLQEIASKFHLQIIEDAAEALGSEYDGQKVSASTGIGIISFNGNKIITTGGGGAVVIQDAALAQKIRHLSTTAKKPHRYEFEHDEIGHNLRLPAINAALGYSQMQKIDSFLKKKKNLYKKYVSTFSDIDIGNMFNPNSFGESNNWLNAFILSDKNKSQKNEVLDYLNDRNISARPLWKPLHMLDIYKYCPRSDCSSTSGLYERVICLPSSAFLGDYE